MSLNDSSHNLLEKSDLEILEWRSFVNVHMSCPEDRVAALIGKKGSVMREITRRSNATIFIDQNFPCGHPRQIQISGNPRSLALAIALLTAVIEHGPSVLFPSDESNHEEEVIVEEMTCPASRVGALIGSKGSHSSEIFKRTGCRIQIMHDGTAPEQDRKVTLTGKMNQIMEARLLAEQLIECGKFIGSENHSTTYELDIEPTKVKEIIGAKGCIVSDIVRRSGSKVHVDQNFPPGTKHKVVFSGSQDQVDLAHHLVELIIKNGFVFYSSVVTSIDSIIVKSIQLECCDLPLSIAFQQLVFDSLAVSVFMSQGAGLTRFVGKPEQVDIAVQLLYCRSNKLLPVKGESPLSPVTPLGRSGSAGWLEPVIHLKDNTFQQVAEVTSQYVGQIVGSNSFNLNLIMKQSGANIQILKSDRTKGTTKIVLLGDLHSVSCGSQLIQEVLVNGPAKLLASSLSL